MLIVLLRAASVVGTRLVQPESFILGNKAIFWGSKHVPLYVSGSNSADGDWRRKGGKVR